MDSLNFKHLRYFWIVAKAGSIARASEQLHVTPHAISGQIGLLEESLGVALFARTGRRLVLTESGERILGLAEEIFMLGNEIVDLSRDPAERQVARLRVGICDSVPKSVSSRLLSVAFSDVAPARLVCREGRLASLLGELALHRLDAVIADRPMPTGLGVRAYTHLLGESALSVFGAPALVARHGQAFPRCLDQAPFLMPGDDVAFRADLTRWFARHRLRPRVVAEVDDLALLKAFGQEGAGFFVAPSVIAPFICQQYDVVCLGELPEVREQVFLITSARRIVHPVLLAISRQAEQVVFHASSSTEGGGKGRRHRPVVAPGASDSAPA